MLRLKLILCLVILFVPGLVLPGLVWGQVPNLVSYRGLLLDPNGNPVTGAVNIELGVWTDALSTAPADRLYNEVHLNVGVVDGVFQVALGGGAFSVGTFDANLFAAPGRWLEIIADGEVLTPRQSFLTVPFAFQAQSALTANVAASLGGLTPADIVTSVAAGTGLSGGGFGGSVTLNADTSVLQARVIDPCPVGQSIRGINSDGSVTCELDSDTTLSEAEVDNFVSNNGYLTTELDPQVGTLIVGKVCNSDGAAVNCTLDPTVDTNAATLCAAGELLNGDGTCDPIPQGDITEVIAGTGLTGGGVNGSVALSIGTISSANISNEAGMAWEVPGTQISLPIRPLSTTVRSLTISAPSAGFIVVNASGGLQNISRTGTGFHTACAITIDSTEFPANPGLDYLHADPSEVPFALTLGSSVGAGDHLIRVLCRAESAGFDVRVHRVSLTAVFVPSNY